MKRGFSLAEVMFAIGILAMALIALLNLAGSALKNSSRTENLALATDLAEREISRAIYSAMNDQPAGSFAQFWDQEYTSMPWRQGTRQLNGMDFQFAIYAQTVADPLTGKPVGAGASDNRIKKVDILVWWMHSDPKQGRQGYGQLRTAASRIVNEQAKP